MTRVFDLNEWTSFRLELRQGLGFVPTMGALHEGHLSLMAKSLEENEKTLVSIFVNPTQFDSQGDLDSYPIVLEEDLAKLSQLGVDYLLTPNYKTIYPDSYKYRVTENSFSKRFCGAHREGHFDGVLTIVLKLLNLAQADRAYFGEKDYQQLQLIREMARAFFLPTQIIGLPTVREQDGLALSSRNQRLSPEQRALAPQFHKCLVESSSPEEAEVGLRALGFQVDYVEDHQGRRFGAASLGEVRLIDNVQV